MPTLLEKALAVKVSRVQGRVNKEDIELIIAWMDGRVTLSQIRKAKDFTSSSAVYTYICFTFREMHRSGQLRVAV